ncbi:MAG TPA: hypothetical protein VN717_02980 [Gemmatimonadaceae bacterium]|nr:hypothetical protein [Gemmatimonadaceae bacterium]
MNSLLAPSQLATVHLVLTALVLVWDLAIAGRAARLQTTPRTMAFLCALSGLLLLPALTVLLVSTSILTGRALYTLAWVWPATLVVIAIQAAYALSSRAVAPPIGVPIVAYDVVLALIGIARYAIYRGYSLPAPLLVLSAADSSSLAYSASPLALVLPYFLHVPIVAPPTRGRRGAGTLLRTAVGALAGIWVTLIILDVPVATRAVTSYSRYTNERLTERADSDFAIGLKIFPTITSGPPPLALDNDLDLADTIGAQALSVYIAPAGTSNASLDSLAHSLADQRGDRQLFVALDLSGQHRPAASRQAAYFDDRAADIARIIRELHPDVIVPVIDPNGAASRALGRIPIALWISYFRRSATIAHQAKPAVRVLAHIGGFGARDSALYAWAAAPASPIDAIGFTLTPWLGGAATLDARMHTLDGWLSSYPVPKEHWLLETGGLPMVHGEQSQARAIWGSLAWATSRSALKGAIVFQAGDYGTPIGLRAPGGRLRPAAAVVARAIRVLSENAGP